MGPFDDIRLRDLEFFDRLRSIGSLTQTARELGIPKATASRWLAQLEERVGVPLVLRTTRSIAFTEPGREFAKRARELLLIAHAAQMAVQGDSPTGTLRVSVPVPLGRMLAGRVIARFLERLPRVRLEIKLQNERVDLISEGIDLAIRGGSLTDSDLITRRLTAISLWLYVSARHRDDVLGEIPFIASPGDEMLVRRAKLDAPMTAAVVVDDRSAVADALVWGAGIGLLPGFLGEPPRATGAVERWSDEPIVALPIHAVYHASQRNDPRLQVLIEEIEAQLNRMV